ncbi:cytochrome c oxidase assembly protein subunit 15 [Microbacterium sp. AK009]|uniref:COX15/CtaA family protein n=1 Tax=Microbacterium sp. AK009 TaxID=2723068 RepID=UPI0015CCA6E3|nr:COX15/CtaA family protein [Microbacterium sp. AK009]NYF16244.1 cytochrome c oxidase assembly protein subunit 15 [Microbacterium sp. AK009]
MSAPALVPPRPRRPANGISRPLRVFAWLSFLAEVLIIGTGGAVRLTGSGLGCPTWPRCTAESIVPTPEMGIHGVIEFGNRTLTGLVGILALAVVLLIVLRTGGRKALTASLWFAAGGILGAAAVLALGVALDFPAGPLANGVLLAAVIAAAVRSVRTTPARRDLVLLAWLVLIGVVAQALVGGITVLTGLNPFIVGFHYVVSVVLVCVTAAFLARMNRPELPRESAVPVWLRWTARGAVAALVVTIVFGILTTGAGPHSGDAAAGRSGFDAELLEHVHAWPSYALFALTIALFVGAWRQRDRTPLLARWSIVLLGAEVVQIAVGLFQARNGLPILAVGVHMVLAALTAAAMTAVVLHLTRPVTDSPILDVRAASDARAGVGA